MSEISKAKNAELPLSGIEDDLIAEIAVAYQNELRAQNSVDFDDLLLLGTSEDILVVPGELDVGVVSIGTGDPKVDLAHVLGGSRQNHF